MKFNAVVHRFIIKEMLAPFMLSTSLLLFVFMMTSMLQLTNLVVNYRVDLLTVARMMLYLIPSFMEFIIPLSSMVAVLLTFLKMSKDNEIVALKAGGVGLYHLMPPVLVFCLIAFFLTAFMSIFGLPWGKNAVRELMLNLSTSSYSAVLKERTFNDSFKGMMVYVNKTDPKTKTLIDVFIEDRNNRGTVITVTAPRGQMIDSQENDTFHLRLYDGFINQVQLKNNASHGIRFETYNVRLSLSRAKSAASATMKKKDQMSYTELRNYTITAEKKDERYYSILLELHKKFSLPFACIALGILAVPLGIQVKSTKRYYGIGLAFLFFLLYYLMLSAGKVFGEAGIYPPVLGMWMPNIILGSLGLFLLTRSANERPLFRVNPLAWLIKNRLPASLIQTDQTRPTSER
jgi:lipopolysaccharide export system permease protein